MATQGEERLSEIEKQEDIRISVDNVKTVIRNMTNWKPYGPYCVQGYWFKRFSTMQSRLTEHLQTCVLVGDVPTWMTKGKRKCCQQLPPYHMPTAYVGAADKCVSRKSICTPF